MNVFVVFRTRFKVGQSLLLYKFGYLFISDLSLFDQVTFSSNQNKHYTSTNMLSCIRNFVVACLLKRISISRGEANCDSFRLFVAILSFIIESFIMANFL